VTKLRNVLAVALLLVPAVTLNASSLPSSEARPGLGSPQPVAGMCWVYAGNRWWYVPC
jgi:hypothetical protein